MRCTAGAVGIKRLGNRLSVRKYTDLIANRECGLQPVIFYSNLAAFGGNRITGALDFTQPLPTLGVYRAAIAFAHKAILFK